jgi:hypothetical protein
LPTDQIDKRTWGTVGWRSHLPGREIPESCKRAVRAFNVEAGVAEMSMLALYKKSSFRKWLHEWETLIVALINAFIVVGVAIFVTSAVTNSQKRTEFFMNFTKKYQDILFNAHRKSNEIATKHLADASYQLSRADEGDAHQIYFQLFGLIYDEYTAYQNNFLDDETITNWLTWQMHDFNDKKFNIGGVLYEDAWKEWLTGPARDHSLTQVINKIFECRDRECVTRVIMSAPMRYRIFCTIR